jgi:crossover junction endodeoxyribonuclease RuvC
MKILAIDASLTSTGWARVVKNGWIWVSRVGTLPTGKRRGTDRLVYIRESLLSLVTGADLVVLEGYAFARTNQAHQIGELGGVLRVAFAEAGIPLVVVAPMARAKYATGKGNAKKEAVLVEAVRRLGYEGSSNDEADALWLLYMALDHYGLGGAVDMPKVNREALVKPSWPELGA